MSKSPVTGCGLLTTTAFETQAGCWCQRQNGSMRAYECARSACRDRAQSGL